VNAASADGWWIESDYPNSNCHSTPTWLYIISVLADRNQTSDCLPTSTGSIIDVCDFTSSPISYYANKYTDASCGVEDVSAEVSARYCLDGSSSSLIVSCKKEGQRVVPQKHADHLNIVEGYAYFSNNNCHSNGFYHAELAPVASCSATYPPSNRNTNQCYPMRGGSQNYLCGTISEVLSTIGFTLGGNS